MASGGAVIANDHGRTDLQVQHDWTGWLSRLRQWQEFIC